MDASHPKSRRRTKSSRPSLPEKISIEPFVECFSAEAASSSSTATALGRNRAICRCSISVFRLVDRQAARNLSGKFAMTSRLFCPMEPVEPRMQIFFISSIKTICPNDAGQNVIDQGTEMLGGKQTDEEVIGESSRSMRHYLDRTSFFTSENLPACNLQKYKPLASPPAVWRGNRLASQLTVYSHGSFFSFTKVATSRPST